jgi:hypothetical protein
MTLASVGATQRCGIEKLTAWPFTVDVVERHWQRQRMRGVIEGLLYFTPQ